MIIEQLIAALGFDLQGEADLKRFKQGMDSAEKSVSAFTARLVAFGAAAGVAAAGGLAALSKSVIDVSAQFEGYAATLETIEGSTAKAQASLDWISDFAKKTPFEVAELTEAFVRLRAYGMDPTSGLMESLGNASSAMGKSLMQAVEMVADASTGEFERLKEFGIRASQEGDKVTFAWTENGKALTRVVKKNGADITNFIQEQFGLRFAGAMIRQAKTWNGMLSNLGDTWTAFQKRIGDAGWFEDVKRRLAGILDTVGEWDRNGGLDRAAGALSTIFSRTLDTAEHVGSQLFTIGKGAFYAASGIVDLVSRITGLNKVASIGVLGAGALAMSAGGRGLMLALGKRIPALGALLAVDDIMTGLGGGDSYIGKLEGGQEALDALRGKFEALGQAVNGLAQALGAVGNIDPSTWKFGDFFDTELVRFANDLSVVVDDITATVNALKRALNFDFSGDFLGKGLKIDFQKPEWLQWMTGGGDTSSGPPPAANKNARQVFEERYRNAQAHIANMTGGMPANAAMNDNRQDHRNQSVTVQVGGVTVQGVQNAGAAVGSAVGKAVGSGAAGAARVSRFEKDDAF